MSLNGLEVHSHSVKVPPVSVRDSDIGTQLKYGGSWSLAQLHSKPMTTHDANDYDDVLNNKHQQIHCRH